MRILLDINLYEFFAHFSLPCIKCLEKEDSQSLLCCKQVIHTKQLLVEKYSKTTFKQLHDSMGKSLKDKNDHRRGNINNAS